MSVFSIAATGHLGRPPRPNRVCKAEKGGFIKIHVGFIGTGIGRDRVKNIFIHQEITPDNRGRINPVNLFF